MTTDYLIQIFMNYYDIVTLIIDFFMKYKYHEFRMKYLK